MHQAIHALCVSYLKDPFFSGYFWMVSSPYALALGLSIIYKIRSRAKTFKGLMSKQLSRSLLRSLALHKDGLRHQILFKVSVCSFVISNRSRLPALHKRFSPFYSSSVLGGFF